MSVDQQPFRIGIVGCGRIAPRHVEACLDSPRSTIGVLVDPCHERAEQLATRFGLSVPICSELEDAFGEADGFIIATPNHLHSSAAIACLEAGRPVLIEKPLATTFAEGQRICSISEQTGVQAAVGYVTRFRRNIRLMRDLLQSGFFGQVERFAYQYGARGGWTPYSGYTLDRAAMGGGVLVSTGSHFLDRMMYWFGEPIEVGLEDDSLGGPEANAHVSVRYDWDGDPMYGTALFSRTVALKPGLVIESERGIVILEDEVDAEIRVRPVERPDLEMVVRDRPQGAQSIDGVSTDSFVLQLEDFVDSVRSGRAPAVSAREGLRVQQFIERLYANRTALPTDWYIEHLCGTAV